MNSDVAMRTSAQLRRFGTVKWFGGVNGKTGRENHFGFIEDINSKDVFLHRREWRGHAQPDEGDMVTYLEFEKDGKFSASQAEGLDSARLGVTDWFFALCAPPWNAAGQGTTSELRAKVEERLRRSLAGSRPEDLRQLVQMLPQSGVPSIFAIVANSKDAEQHYALLLEAAGLRVTDHYPWAEISRGVASHFEIEIAAQLGELDPDVAREKCLNHLAVLPPSVLTYLLTRGVFGTTDQLGSMGVTRVYDYVSSVIIHEATNFPEYLRASFDASLVMHGGQSASSILRDIVDNLRFKKSLFEKNTDFIDIYSASPRLQRNIETFILHHLLGLIVAGNDHEIVYSVFMQRLWEALTSRALPFERQTAKLQTLFPPCITMGPGLSCEAVHWPKKSIFLCRGKTCLSPRIFPDFTHHFLHFNIYDWLSHYGIDYMAHEKPQAKDFPIKLASYFNRLREIFPVLHCRACSDVMLPNTKYARTQYMEFVDGVAELKDMAAAYRLTVFHCNNNDCEKFDVGHYISHCVGFGCYHIIDSRDLKQRCSEDRYVCRGCGSCCRHHAQSHPVGLCAECGNEIEVWNENVRGRQVSYSRKYVKCKSDACGFTIPGVDLPAKFSLFPAINDAEEIRRDLGQQNGARSQQNENGAKSQI